MEIIKLISLRIENFKGIKNLLIKFDGKDTNIFGNNATCKTSVEDAWRWLLFNKDSEDKEDTNFTIKPQDKDGKDIMGTESLVEAELLVDGKPLMLKKVRHEKWTKRQGTGETVFDGHQRKYWFDEEPVNATKYKEKMNELLTEDIFKMITNPLYFNTQVDWKKRLEILYEIYIKETDLEIINSNYKISKLAEILEGKEIESYENILKDKIKNLKKERNDLPPRIDEIIKSLPQEEPDYSEVETELSKHKETLAGIEFLLTNATNKANELNKKHQELYYLKGQLEKVKEKIKAESGTDRAKLLEKKAELENGKFILQSGIRELELDIQQTRAHLESNARTRQILLDEWRSLSDKSLEILTEEMEVATIASHCPVCEQKIPEEVISAEFESFKAKFDKSKKDRLAENMALLDKNKESGLTLKLDTEKTQSELELSGKELENKKLQLENLEVQISELNEEISKPQPEPDYKQYADYTVLFHKIVALETELDKPIEDKSAELLKRKSDIQAKIDELNKVLNSKEEVEKKKERIDFLKNEEKRIANLIAELEGHNFLIDEFYIVKTEMVNKHFEHVRFRFFENNDTNDGRQKMCVAEVNTNGSYVKFDDANTAGQVNAGLNIINILCDFYGVRAPIFVDNAERITDLIETDSQVIRLVKPEIRDEEDRKKYSQLVVEVE